MGLPGVNIRSVDFDLFGFGFSLRASGYTFIHVIMITKRTGAHLQEFFILFARNKEGRREERKEKK